VRRVVLILDEPDRCICAEKLQACGMHVAAGDPGDTDEIGSDEHTVVVLDIGMFGASGLAILRRLVVEPAAVNALRIVVLADWGEPAMERLVLRLGADAFLTKPVMPAQLLSAIERLLGPAVGVDPTGPACGPKPSADGPLPVGSLHAAKSDRPLGQPGKPASPAVRTAS